MTQEIINQERIEELNITNFSMDLGSCIAELENTKSIKRYIEDCQRLIDYYKPLSVIDALSLYDNHRNIIDKYSWRLNKDELKKFNDQLVQLLPIFRRERIKMFDESTLRSSRSYSIH